MNGNTVEDLKRMLDEIPEEDLPTDVTRRLLAIMILTNTDSINSLTEAVEKNHREITSLFTDMNSNFTEHVEREEELKVSVFKEIEDLKEQRKNNPTICEWIKAHPKKTIVFSLGIFLLSNIWFVSGIRYWVTYTILHLFKFQPEFIHKVLDLLFA